MLGNSPIQSVLVPLDQLDDFKKSTNSNILGIINFSENDNIIKSKMFPQVNISLKQLNSHEVAEVWKTTESTSYHLSNFIRYSIAGSIMFGCLEFDHDIRKSLEYSTYMAYCSIMETLDNENYSSLLRTWNYLPNINDNTNNVERYKLFCKGRKKSFDKFQSIVKDIFPAATVIGTKKGPGIIYFIGSKNPGVQIENPRQISAFQYPEQYGPVSPSFSRSIYKEWGNQSQLFISGTASIVGHKTEHQNHHILQLEEIILNLNELISKFKKELPQIYPIKVYLRNAKQLLIVKQKIDKYFGKGHPVMYLLGDICRSDLLVEIEGILH
jgi:chorismate lyase / 3-hydroxybenzoate synthase